MAIKRNNDSGQVAVIIFFTILIIFSILMAKSFTLPFPLLVLIVFSGISVILVTFLNTDLALIILIFSMLLSPEIPIAKIPERAVVIRVDDILLCLVFFTWLAKMAINKRLGFFKNTPMNWPMALYTILCLVFTALAIFLGIGEAKFTSAFFYILKYSEYMMLFFLVASNIKSIKQSKSFVAFLLLTCVIVSVFGYFQMHQGVNRVSAPFEGDRPEPNTLAGYLLIIYGLIAGLFLYSKSLKQKLILAAIFLFSIPVFMATLSRSGYVGFIVMYLCFIIFKKSKRLFLIGLLIITVAILPFVLPSNITKRIKTTFKGKAQYQVLGKRVTLEESAAARFEVWKYITEVSSKSPIFGYGVTGIKFVDTQYGRILGELGILGLLAFFWMIYSLLSNVFKIFKEAKDDYIKGLSLGFLSSLIAILVICWGANMFVIVRVMEPFWFIAAMVFMLPQLLKNESQPTEIIGT